MWKQNRKTHWLSQCLMLLRWIETPHSVTQVAAKLGISASRGLLYFASFFLSLSLSLSSHTMSSLFRLFAGGAALFALLFVSHFAPSVGQFLTFPVAARVRVRKLRE